jgi:ribonuclease P protein component
VTPFFVLKTKKGVTEKNRIGIIISATTIKSAARRNFWKRQTKANFKLLPDAGKDFLIIFSEDKKNYTTKEFKKTFLRAAKSRVLTTIENPITQQYPT